MEGNSQSHLQTVHLLAGERDLRRGFDEPQASAGLSKKTQTGWPYPSKAVERQVAYPAPAPAACMRLCLPPKPEGLRINQNLATSGRLHDALEKSSQQKKT